MSKQLYPKPRPASAKKTKPKDDPFDHPYHVYYEDPSGELEPEWKHYNTEEAAKADAWMKCRLVGFHTKATLFGRDEFNEQALGPALD